MKHIFVCPLDDTIKIAVVDLRSDGGINGVLRFQTYTPPNPPLFPYVPAYLQQYQEQPRPLRQFLREYMRSFLPRGFMLALHDDATDLEANAMSELLIACGAKDVPMEYRAFLLSTEPEYISVTASKRAVTVTRVITGKDDTERIFLPVGSADADTVQEAVTELDPDGQLPVFTFGLPESLRHIGEAISEGTLARNFVRIL